jgi:hypothetical protein
MALDGYRVERPSRAVQRGQFDVAAVQGALERVKGIAVANDPLDLQVRSWRLATRRDLDGANPKPLRKVECILKCSLRHRVGVQSKLQAATP